jgi:two-component system, oxyanion-binding sensor
MLDSALLVAAQEKHFAAAEGVDPTLMRERSRRTSAIGLRSAISRWRTCWRLCSRTVTPMALGLGGNAVTVSMRLWRYGNARRKSRF